MPCCSRCWGNGSDRTNRVPVFLEFASCFEDIANKQINKDQMVVSATIKIKQGDGGEWLPVYV